VGGAPCHGTMGNPVLGIIGQHRFTKQWRHTNNVKGPRYHGVLHWTWSHPGFP